MNQQHDPRLFQDPNFRDPNFQDPDPYFGGGGFPEDYPSYPSYGSYGYSSYPYYGSSKGSKDTKSKIKKAVAKVLKKKCKKKSQPCGPQTFAVNVGCGDAQGSSGLASMIQQRLCKPPMALNLCCDKNATKCCQQFGTKCCPQLCRNTMAPNAYAPNAHALNNRVAPYASAPNTNAHNANAVGDEVSCKKLCKKITKKCSKRIDRKCCDKIAAKCCKKIATKCDLIDTKYCDKICVKCCEKPNCCDKLCVKCCDKPNCCDKICVKCCDTPNCCDKLCVKCCDKPNCCDKLCVKCCDNTVPSASEISKNMSKMMKHIEATCYKSRASNAEKVESKLKKAALRAKYDLKKRSTNGWKQNPYLLFIMGMMASSLVVVLIGFLTGTLSVRTERDGQNYPVGAFKNEAAEKYCNVRAV